MREKTAFEQLISNGPEGSEQSKCRVELDRVERTIYWMAGVTLPDPWPHCRRDVVLNLMFRSARTRLPRLHELGRQGAMTDVAVLLRASYELHISASYIFHSDDPERLARQFVAFEKVIDLRTLTMAAELAPGAMTPERRAERKKLAADLRQLEKEFPTMPRAGGTQPWSGIGHRAMIEAATKHGLDSAYLKKFTSDYPLLCSLSHPTWGGICGIGHFGLLASLMTMAFVTFVNLHQLNCRSLGVPDEVPRDLFLP
jgi:hypothetical protein